MTDRPPTWAELNVAPAPKASPWKIAGIGCGTLIGATVILGIIGAIVGPPKTSPSTHQTISAAPATSAANETAATTQTPTSKATTTQKSASKATTATPTRSAARPKKPAPVPSGTDLAFSGGLTGSTTQALNVLPTKTGAHYDYKAPEGSTQCVMPADDGTWKAQVTFKVKGITWEIHIGAPSFGLPKVGSHPALYETLTGGAYDDPNAVSLWVGSDKNPDRSGGVGSGIGRFGFSYYTPTEHNNGAGTVAINNGFASGTLDVWLTPSMPENLEFHVTGRWACN